jgi:hypothetical protein
MPFANEEQRRRARQNLCMAYLAYSDELIPIDALDRVEAGRVAKATIEHQMISLPTCKSASGSVDWNVVWGPASFTLPEGILQDNAMFVVEQISQPGNLIVAIRGTNGDSILDWIVDDTDVWTKLPWVHPPGGALASQAQISRATHDALDVLLNKLLPTEGQGGCGLSLEAFLAARVSQGMRISFTGHSLAGALSPTLALWFKQRQGLAGGWDADGKATISVVAFAGATPGNAAFAELFDAQLGAACMRIHNERDIVPHAWDALGMGSVGELYESAGISPNVIERALIAGIRRTVHGYAQIATSFPLRWEVQNGAHGFLTQALLQHVRSYPSVLQVPELLELPVFAATKLCTLSPRKVARLLAKTGLHFLKQELDALRGAQPPRQAGFRSSSHRAAASDPSRPSGRTKAYTRTDP